MAKRASNRDETDAAASAVLGSVKVHIKPKLVHPTTKLIPFKKDMATSPVRNSTRDFATSPIHFEEREESKGGNSGTSTMNKEIEDVYDIGNQPILYMELREQPTYTSTDSTTKKRKNDHGAWNISNNPPLTGLNVRRFCTCDDTDYTFPVLMLPSSHGNLTEVLRSCQVPFIYAPLISDKEPAYHSTRVNPHCPTCRQVSMLFRQKSRLLCMVASLLAALSDVPEAFNYVRRSHSSFKLFLASFESPPKPNNPTVFDFSLVCLRPSCCRTMEAECRSIEKLITVCKHFLSFITIFLEINVEPYIEIINALDTNIAYNESKPAELFMDRNDLQDLFTGIKERFMHKVDSSIQIQITKMNEIRGFTLKVERVDQATYEACNFGFPNFKP